MKFQTVQFSLVCCYFLPCRTASFWHPVVECPRPVPFPKHEKRNFTGIWDTGRISSRTTLEDVDATFLLNVGSHIFKAMALQP
jgi:hypothetical protein